ncbi:hypothetical protein PRUPE_5G039000 [Prunus persica]|uniref:Uncharacterized protein n=1 Tax=Prunus persica TaxID=3760 RepID=A0A251P3C8_PRUPE|nr:hypothetical protein PRUPE_5G039000 [Prunus persica]
MKTKKTKKFQKKTQPPSPFLPPPSTISIPKECPHPSSFLSLLSATDHRTIIHNHPNPPTPPTSQKASKSGGCFRV